MAKVQIKSEKLTPFGGIFSIMEQFDSMLSPIIDQTLGQRCRSIIGYQYSKIIRSLMSVYFCGGSCVEDVTSALKCLGASSACFHKLTSHGYAPAPARCSRPETITFLMQTTSRRMRAR